MCKLRRLVNLLICCIQLTVTNIVHDRAGKQVGILKHDSQRTAKIVFFDLTDIDAVIADLTFLNIIKTIDQVGDGRFSRTCGSYKRQLLSRLCIKTDILQDHLSLIHISAIYILFS